MWITPPQCKRTAASAASRVPALWVRYFGDGACLLRIHFDGLRHHFDELTIKNKFKIHV